MLRRIPVALLATAAAVAPPAHIHVTVQEPDGSPEYWLDSFLFDGDPLLGPDDVGPHVLEPVESGGRILHARRDIVLPAEPRR